LAARDRTYCDACLAKVQKQVAAAHASKAAAERKTAGLVDRRSAAATKAKRWQALTDREDERRRWEAKHGRGPDRETFLREIAPSLHDVPVTVLIEATGLSRPMCHRILRGMNVPHPRHWDAIRTAVKQYAENPKPIEPWQELPDTTFRDQIVPFLAEVSTREIVAVTGFSDTFISRLRRGRSAPHRRHWPALLALIEREVKSNN